MSQQCHLSLSEALHQLYKISNEFPLSISTVFTNSSSMHFKQICEAHVKAFEKIQEVVYTIGSDVSHLMSLGSKDKATYYYLDAFFGQNALVQCLLTENNKSMDRYSGIHASETCSMSIPKSGKDASYSLKAREEKLLKVVKMDPNRVEGWNALGHCLWEKKDYEAARTSYERAISISDSLLRSFQKGESLHKDQSFQKNCDDVYNLFVKKQAIIAHRELSIVLRLISTSITDVSQVPKLVNESYSHAQKAVKMDFADGESWSIMGNALLCRFLRSNSMQDVDAALQAYTRALSFPHADSNPELHFNKAIVCKFKQLYVQAYIGFTRAIEIDDTFTDAKQELENILTIDANICNLIEKQGNMKKKRLSKFVDTIPKLRNSISYTDFKISESNLTQLEKMTDHLKFALPKSKSNEIIFKIFQLVNNKFNIPLVFIAVDSGHNFFLTSIYNVDSSAIKDGDTIAIEDPEVSLLALPISDNDSSKDVPKVYKCLNVVGKDVTKIRVNGRKIIDDKVLPPSFTMNTK